MFDKLLFLFLIISPTCYSLGEDVFQYADRFLMTGTMILACFAFLFCKPARYAFPKWPAVLLLFCIAKLYYLPYHWLSMHAVFNVFFPIALFYLILNYAQDIRWFYRGIGVAVLANLSYGMLNHWGYSPIFNQMPVPSAFFASCSDLSGYLILTIPLMARFGKGSGFLLPFAFCVIFLQNYTSIFCNFVSCAMITLRKGFYPMLFLVIIAISIVSFYRQELGIWHKLKYRAEIWKEVADGAFLHPLVGNGLGKAVGVTAHSGSGAYTAKSEYLEFAWEVGIVTAIVITGFIFCMLIKRYIQAQKSWDLTLLSISLLAFAISLLIQPHLRNPKISPTVMAVLGWFYILSNKPKEA